MPLLLPRLKQGLRPRVPLLVTHRTSRQQPNSVRFLSTTSSSSSSATTDHSPEDRSISIGDVSVTSPPLGSGRSDLVPDLGLAGSGDKNTSSSHSNKIRRLLEALSPSWTSNLRWMLQKDMVLNQDFCLLGPAYAAQDRRSLAFLYAAVTGREVEYVSLSRDTSDYDLKQRKEVVAGNDTDKSNSSTTTNTTSTYMHQAPVRAALHGRLLILDGLEKAERNVLPTLNNLLENREMSLDDGSMLVSAAVFDQQEQQQSSSASASVKMHRVHPDFCVAALGSMYADTSSSVTSLDPPLRSRFQARLQAPLDPGELLQALAATSNGRLDEPTLKELVYMVTTATTTTTTSASETETSTLSLSSILDAVHYYLDYGSHFKTPVDAILRGHGMGFVGVADVKKDSLLEFQSPSQTPIETLSPSSSFVTTPSRQVIMDLVTTGLKSGRAVACVGPKGCGKSAITAELARATNRTCELFSLFKDQTSRDLLLTRGTDEQGNTMWRKTPLTRAVENGTMVILDGIDKLSSDTLSSIARLLEQRQVDLPDGTRLTAHDDFACVALAHPSQVKRSWIAPEISGMFYWVQVQPLATNELETVLSGLFPDLDASQLNAIVRLRDRLDEAVESGAADTMDEKESLVLSLRKMKHICKRVGRKGSDLAQLVKDALVTSLMPDREKRIVESCMVDCGIHGQPKDDTDGGNSTLDEELLARWRRTPSQPLLVPNPRFEENPGHAAVLRDLLDAHSVGERALLIMGYQGVG
jgi:MoxR-like ATPase